MISLCLKKFYIESTNVNNQFWKRNNAFLISKTLLKGPPIWNEESLKITLIVPLIPEYFLHDSVVP